MLKARSEPMGACKSDDCKPNADVVQVLFAKTLQHASHLKSRQRLSSSTRSFAALPHRGQVKQAWSEPSSPRISLSENTAAAVPGKARVARKIARSYSLSERGFLVIGCTVPFLVPKPGETMGKRRTPLIGGTRAEYRKRASGRSPSEVPT